MADLVVRSVHGRLVLVKEFFPFKPHEKPNHIEVRRIELSEREEPLDLNVLARLLEFNMLDNA